MLELVLLPPHLLLLSFPSSHPHTFRPKGRCHGGQVLLNRLFFGTERKSVVTKSRETPNAGRRPTTLPTWVRHPPVRHHVSHSSDGATNEAAKATAHVVANMRIQRRSHARTTGHFMAAGTSRALANADSLFAPPASGFEGHHNESAPVGRNQFRISGFLVRAWAKVAPSTSAASGWGSPDHSNAQRGVTSTASCDPPKHGRA